MGGMRRRGALERTGSSGNSKPRTRAGTALVARLLVSRRRYRGLLAWLLRKPVLIEVGYGGYESLVSYRGVEYRM